MADYDDTNVPTSIDDELEGAQEGGESQVPPQPQDGDTPFTPPEGDTDDTTPATDSGEDAQETYDEGAPTNPA